MDRFIIALDKTLKVLTHSPVSVVTDCFPSSIPLMRANYAGEVAAQGLYLGAWLCESDPFLSSFYEEAMRDEFRHLEWCGKRVNALGGRISFFNPVWFIGSVSVGVVSRMAGAQYALGFVSETEKQVLVHLRTHLTRLPKDDIISREIVAQMVLEEAEHADEAKVLGGVELPSMIKTSMHMMGRILTHFSEIL